MCEQKGAVDIDACPNARVWRACCCGECSVCGNRKHTAVHGPRLGHPPGSVPWGHEFEARDGAGI